MRRQRRRPLVTLSVLAIALAIPEVAAAASRWPRDILRQDFGFTAGTRSDVAWSEVTQGCPKRDCIPSIDEPRFTAPGKAQFLFDDDLVLGLARHGAAHAYPAYILDRHEIVNDVIAGEPIAITWCPLCGSGLAFSRVLDGAPVELGVSGLLRESDLVFYDRRTRSLWQQVTGTAFAGPARGQRLTSVPIAVTTWRRWREAHPETGVLTNDNRRTVAPAYGDYARSERLLFPVSRRSALAHPKTVVWGVELPEGALAVTERRLADGKPVAAELAGVGIEVTRLADGSVRAIRMADSAELGAHRMYWFAWYTFHPGTLLEDFEVAK